MAKLSFFSDVRRPDKFGRLPIRLLISNGTSTTTVTTGIVTDPKYFVGEPTQVLVRSAPQAQATNRTLYSIYTRYYDAILTLEQQNRLQYMTAAEIRRTAEGADDLQGEGAQSDFLAFFKEYGDSRNSEKTRKSYTYVAGVLRAYCEERRIKKLTFQDINYSMLTDFARWMRSTGKGDCARHMIESYVRAAYKEAEKRHIISRDNDPYFDYSIASVPPKEIETLTAEDIFKLACAKLDNAGKEQARDVAMMSFFLCGVNLLDLYEMGVPQNGEVVYIRHKTQTKNLRPVHVRIEPELQELLDKHKGKDALLHFKETYASYDTFQRRLNRLLKEVGAELGVDYTFAKIRRTWSSIAGELEISDRVIDKSMGHMDATVKDRHYEKYDWSRTARANRAVIDHVLNL